MMNNERGAVLITSIIILILITLVGIAAVQNTIVSEKETHNTQNINHAFAATEVAMQEAKNWINTQTTYPEPTAGCTQPCVWPYNSAVLPDKQSSTWWAANGAAATATIAGVSTAPRYIIEYLKFVPDSGNPTNTLSDGIHYYRITAIGTSEDNTGTVMVQTTYARRY